MAAWKRWQSEWTLSSRIAIVKDRYLWVCFEELQKDLRSKKYYIDVYDVQTNKKLVNWKEVPARLQAGGEFAYFVFETEKDSTGDYGLELVLSELN